MPFEFSDELVVVLVALDYFIKVQHLTFVLLGRLLQDLFFLPKSIDVVCKGVHLLGCRYRLVIQKLVVGLRSDQLLLCLSKFQLEFSCTTFQLGNVTLILYQHLVLILNVA